MWWQKPKPLQTIRTLQPATNYSPEQIHMAFMIRYAIYAGEFWLVADPKHA